MHEYLILILFPIVFMIHEFEEMIMVEKWMCKNRDELSVRFPVMAKRLEWLTRIDTRSFTVIVAEEFLIASGLTVTSILTGSIIFWYCTFAAFGIHLLMHLLQFFIWKKYIPAIATTTLCLPYCVWAFQESAQSLVLSQLSLYAAIGTTIAGINLLCMHRLMLKYRGHDKREIH